MQRRLLLLFVTVLALLVIFCINLLTKSRVEDALNWSLTTSALQSTAPLAGLDAPPPMFGEQGHDTPSQAQEALPSNTLSVDTSPLDTLSLDAASSNSRPSGSFYEHIETPSLGSPLTGYSATNPLPLDIDGLDSTAEHAISNNHLKEEVYPFQLDLDLPQPTRDLMTLARYRPHNLASTGRHPTYATYFASRSPSIQDPYFMSTQQVIYRTLWAPTTASPKYPFTVFVAPFITKQQRDLFRGAGANVIELPLIEFTPVNAEIFARWKDLFSRLHMWNQTQFTRITFLDGDAFPLQQVDDIFEAARPQKCIREKLDAVDLAVADDICDYVFSGVQVIDHDEINMAVAVFSPNKAMHARLLRNMDQTDHFDNAMVEQAYLGYQFETGGAFPKQFLPRRFNGYYPQPEERWSLKIVHEKLWIFDIWGDNLFEEGNKEMVRFYDSEEFVNLRKGDGQL